MAWVSHVEDPFYARSQQCYQPMRGLAQVYEDTVYSRSAWLAQISETHPKKAETCRHSTQPPPREGQEGMADART